MFFDQVESFFALLDRVKGWLNKRAPAKQSIASRFVLLFESHAVHRNQIPRFLGHGLTIADMQSDEALITKLTEDVLNAACEKFAIRREWLDGADNQIYPLHDFYKKPEEFIEFIERLNAREGANLYGNLLVVKNKPKNRDEDALLILEEHIGQIGDRTIYRYHICNNWIFTYWKARTYLTACVASAWKRRIYIDGRYITEEFFYKYCEGLNFLEYQICDEWGALPPIGNKWDPEYLACDPEFFLEGIDEEYGLVQGLSFWLDLEKRGLMDDGSPGSNAKERFEKKLATIKTSKQKIE